MIFVRIFILIVACLVATKTDLKKTEIPDWLTIGLILLAIVFNIIEFGFLIALKYIGISIILFLLLLILYKKLNFGGGDIKLLIGVSQILPIYHDNYFVLFVLLISSIVSLVISLIFKKKDIKFAPFILAGVVVSLLII